MCVCGWVGVRLCACVHVREHVCGIGLVYLPERPEFFMRNSFDLTQFRREEEKEEDLVDFMNVVVAVMESKICDVAKRKRKRRNCEEARRKERRIRNKREREMERKKERGKARERERKGKEE